MGVIISGAIFDNFWPQFYNNNNYIQLRSVGFFHRGYSFSQCQALHQPACRSPSRKRCPKRRNILHDAITTCNACEQVREFFLLWRDHDVERRLLYIRSGLSRIAPRSRQNRSSIILFPSAPRRSLPLPAEVGGSRIVSRGRGGIWE